MTIPLAKKTGTQAGAERWILFASILASGMAFIDGSALNVALPSLQADLRASGAQLCGSSMRICWQM
jgi:hypothetical protein